MGQGLEHGASTRWGRWVFRLAVAVGFACALSYLPYRLVGGTGEEKLRSMRVELENTKVQIAAHRARIVERRRRVQALKDDPHSVEDIARDQLNMLYPHETNLRLTNTGAPKGAAETNAGGQE